MTSSRHPIVRSLGRWWSVWVIALFAVGVSACKPYDNGPPIRSDGNGYHIWTYAILKGDISFSWFQGDSEDVRLVQLDPTVKRYICKYPPGVALIRLPVMGFLTDPNRNGPPFSESEQWACLACSALALTATAGWDPLESTCRHASLSIL